jgi:hypothetical protein
MDTKDQYIAELAETHQATRALLKDLETAHQTNRELYPTWTGKELISHLAGWDDACIAALNAFSSGATAPPPAAIGFDPFNASTVGKRKDLSLAEVIADWDARRRIFLEAIRDLPDEKVEAVMVFPWGPSGTLAEMVAIFVDHEHEHAEDIRKLISAN